mmetsp:Transcript_12017/g.18832  ORF Transcript_12017/g.18832 Transcript_12017/m.18832 type:complete len:86 (-) Transcript_12017:23-280(-)
MAFLIKLKHPSGPRLLCQLIAAPARLQSSNPKVEHHSGAAEPSEAASLQPNQLRCAEGPRGWRRDQPGSPKAQGLRGWWAESPRS